MRDAKRSKHCARPYRHALCLRKERAIGGSQPANLAYPIPVPLNSKLKPHCIQLVGLARCQQAMLAVIKVLITITVFAVLVAGIVYCGPQLPEGDLISMRKLLLCAHCVRQRTLHS